MKQAGGSSSMHPSSLSLTAMNAPACRPAPPVAGHLGIVKSAALRAEWERASSRGEIDGLCDRFVDSIKRGT